MNTQKFYLLRPLVHWVRNAGITACEQKAQDIADALNPKVCVNVGGGRDGVRWPNAECRDYLRDSALDFNTSRLPWPDAYADLIVCEQVIEHLHNTTWFLSELYRILKPKGRMLLSTENLASIPNIFATVCQKAPFSTQAVCGRFIGGWRDGEAGYGIECAPNHPAFAGVRGHVRVMTVGQLRELFKLAGFTVLAKWGFGANHYVLFYLTR